MTVLASEIIDRVRLLLVDTDDTQRWSDAELLQHLSDGQRTVAAIVPEECSQIVAMQMDEGTRQSLPDDGVSLLNVYRNMGTTGTTPGRAIRLVRREMLDDQNPMWHAEAKTTAIYNYIYDPGDADSFFVYPPSNGLGYIEINYCYVPPEIDATTDAIALSDIYLTALTDFVMYKALQKDSDFAAGMQRAQMHIQAFMLFVQGQDAGAADTSPNTQLQPFRDHPKGSEK